MQTDTQMHILKSVAALLPWETSDILNVLYICREITVPILTISL